MLEVGGTLERNPWLALLAQVTVAALAGLVLHAIANRLAVRAARRFKTAERLLWHTRRPMQILVPLLLVHLALADATIRRGALDGIRQLMSIAVILTITFLVIRLVAAFADIVAQRHPVSVADNLHARSVQTQVRVLARTTMFFIGVIGVGSVLMTFPNVRQIGASVLASAGVAGIVAGLAARPVLGNLIAGLQIALTQPIRVDDVLIVEKEWGRVEEITSTYVVVRIWDDRRLIVPLEYFIQQPFQNWTRHTSDLIGEVTFWVDYRMPVEPLRVALREVLDTAPEWDRRVCVLQVTDFTEKAMKLRALVSTRDAGLGWDLRCKVREHLIAHMQENYPRFMPQVRASLDRHGRDESEPVFHPPPAELMQEGAQAPAP